VLLRLRSICDRNLCKKLETGATSESSFRFSHFFHNTGTCVEEKIWQVDIVLPLFADVKLGRGPPPARIVAGVPRNVHAPGWFVLTVTRTSPTRF